MRVRIVFNTMNGAMHSLLCGRSVALHATSRCFHYGLICAFHPGFTLKTDDRGTKAQFCFYGRAYYLNFSGRIFYGQQFSR